MSRASIRGTGSCLPEKVMSNQDLEKIVETSDEWITSRTGIKTRHIAGSGEHNFQLASVAAKRALKAARITAAELDMIVVATITPHMIMPSCACFVQTEIEAVNAFAFDINAACSGFLYALDLADKYICSKPEMKILVIGSETLSSRVNWEDRNTCILFGDGAGACVVTGSETKGIIDSQLYSDGKLWNLLYMDSPESRNPALLDPDFKGCYIQMTGKDVFKYAVRSMEDSVTTLFQRTSHRLEDVALVIPHQANIRILSKLVERLGVEREKVFINVDKYGNTSAASIPIALDEVSRQGRLHKGDIVLFCSFGGGFTWGSMLLRW